MIRAGVVRPDATGPRFGRNLGPRDSNELSKYFYAQHARNCIFCTFIYLKHCCSVFCRNSKPISVGTTIVTLTCHLCAEHLCE